MLVQAKKVVAIEYTLKDNDGVTIDSSEGRGPLMYIHGIGALVPGLEEALEGKTKGDHLDVQIAPEKAYGIRNEQLVQSVPKEGFPTEQPLQVGMQFQAQTPQGPVIVTVVEIQDKHLVVDGNHPLAGITLNFDVNVVEVREATPEELDHGHVHGPGGHQH